MSNTLYFLHNIPQDTVNAAIEKHFQDCVCYEEYGLIQDFWGHYALLKVGVPDHFCGNIPWKRKGQEVGQVSSVPTLIDQWNLFIKKNKVPMNIVSKHYTTCNFTIFADEISFKPSHIIFSWWSATKLFFTWSSKDFILGVDTCVICNFLANWTKMFLQNLYFEIVFSLLSCTDTLKNAFKNGTSICTVCSIYVCKIYKLISLIVLQSTIPWFTHLSTSQ